MYNRAFDSEVSSTLMLLGQPSCKQLKTSARGETKFAQRSLGGHELVSPVPPVPRRDIKSRNA